MIVRFWLWTTGHSQLFWRHCQIVPKKSSSTTYNCWHRFHQVRRRHTSRLSWWTSLSYLALTEDFWRRGEVWLSASCVSTWIRRRYTVPLQRSLRKKMYVFRYWSHHQAHVSAGPRICQRDSAKIKHDFDHIARISRFQETTKEPGDKGRFSSYTLIVL